MAYVLKLNQDLGPERNHVHKYLHNHFFHETFREMCYIQIQILLLASPNFSHYIFLQ